MMLGDQESLVESVSAAAKKYLVTVKREKDVYALSVVAMSHEVMWRMSADPVEFGKAIEARLRLLALPKLTASGRNGFHQSLGMLLAESGAYSDAPSHLERAGNSVDAIVNLADAYIYLGRIDDAELLLKGVDRDGLREATKLEYLSADAQVARARGDYQQVSTFVAELRSLELSDLYFQRTRDRLCVALLESANVDHAKGGVAAEKQIRGILGWIRYISQFVELKPNYYGLGLNLNRIIEGPPAKK
jgi:hypothetical protein